MSFREQMSQMRREYRKEAGRLDQKIDRLAEQTDQGFGVVQERFGRAEIAVVSMQLQLQTTRDELAATNEAVGQVRADLREAASTLKGRTRLMEDRFGKMLDLVEASVDETVTSERLERIEERLRLLESQSDPAA